MKIDSQDVERIKDPVERARLADSYMESAKELLAELSEIRGQAIREASLSSGVDSVASQLGLRRQSVYRAMAKGDTYYRDQFDSVHRLVTTGGENDGVVFVPAGLVHSEPKLAWVRENYQLTRTGGVSGDPVFKPSRRDWVERMGRAVTRQEGLSVAPDGVAPSALRVNGNRFRQFSG